MGPEEKCYDSVDRIQKKKLGSSGEHTEDVVNPRVPQKERIFFFTIV